MRCSACGARNPEGADFCSQCFTSFAAPHETAVARPARPPPERQSGDVALLDETAAPVTDAAADTRFRRQGNDLDWRCRVCGTWNPIGDSACRSCQQPFARTMADDRPATPRDVSDTATLVATVLLPGLGHILHRRSGTGIARAGLYLLWGYGGLALLRGAASSGQSLLPAVVLLGGALVIWLASVADAYAMTQGSGAELLRPRVFLWLVVAVVLALLAVFTVSALSLPSAGGA